MTSDCRKTVKVEACFEENNFRKKQGIYHEVPLFELKEKYQSEEGKKFLEKLVASQTGRNHPQFKNDPTMKLYKVFVRTESKDGTSSSTTSRVVGEGRNIYSCDEIPLRSFLLVWFAFQRL